MLCALSGKTPDEPVVSVKSGHVFEKRLVLKYLEANNNTCPVTNQPLEPKDLIDVKVNKVVPPRPTTATSIPSLLSIFQNEWDATVLETYTLKQQLESVRQELAHALYQYDAACRVIARTIKERDEARNALAAYRQSGKASAGGAPSKSAQSEAMEVEKTEGLPEEVKENIYKKSQELSKDRKKRQVSPNLASAEDIKGYQMLSTSTLHSTKVTGISCLDIKDNLALTGGNDGEVILYDRSSKSTLEKLSGHKKKITSVKFHPTKEMLFSTSEDGTATFWKNSDGYSAVHVANVHQASVVGCTLQATGDYLAIASADSSWSFHDIASTNVLAHVTADIGFTSIEFHPDGLLLGTGTNDGVVKIYDIKSFKNVANFDEHKGKIVDFTFSENGYYLAAVAEDNIVRLWDLRKSKCVQTIELAKDFGATSLDFDYSGSYLAVGGDDIRVYTKAFEHINTYSKHKGQVTDVKWGADAQFFGSVSADRTIKFWGSK